MPEFKYAKGRISESLQFITKEMKEFEQEYSYLNFRWEAVKMFIDVKPLVSNLLRKILERKK